VTHCQKRPPHSRLLVSVFGNLHSEEPHDLFCSNVHSGRNDVVGGGVGKHGNHITASSSGQQWPAAASLVEKVLK
jgi:hypothetical protein